MNTLRATEAFTFKYDDLINPVLEALHALGGSGTNTEIEERLIDILALSDTAAEEIHRGSTTKLTYRAAWARNYLKRLGLIENSARAVWILTPEGRKKKKIDQAEAKLIVKNLSGTGTKDGKLGPEPSATPPELTELDWTEALITVLKGLEAKAFERLSQRLLRELGFTNVEVTGKSGDGGIDGVGAITVGGVLSFRVVFQCKKYAGTVAPSAIRDFRGAMIGRADKGLFITTGTFSRDAKQESQRDGAPPIDLIDGKALAENLKRLGLGVTVKLVEQVSVDASWFTDV